MHQDEAPPFPPPSHETALPRCSGARGDVMRPHPCNQARRRSQLRPHPLPRYQPVRYFSHGEDGNIRACPLEVTASLPPHGTHPCSGEGRRQDELGP